MEKSIKNSLKRPATQALKRIIREEDDEPTPEEAKVLTARDDSFKAARGASTSVIPPTIVTEIRCAVSEDRGRRTEFEDKAVAVHDGRAEKTAPTRVR